MDPKACLIAMLNAAEVGYQGPDYDFAEYKNDLRQWLLNGGFGPPVRVLLPGTRTRPERREVAAVLTRIYCDGRIEVKLGNNQRRELRSWREITEVG